MLRSCRAQAPLAALLLCVACETSAVVESEWIVRVNGTPITVDEFQQRFAQLAKEVGDLPVLSVAAVTDLKRRTLNEMVDERLLLDAAQAEGVTVAQAEIDAAIAAMRRDIGERDWSRFLLEHYVDDQAWYAAVRRRLTIEKLLDTHLRAAGPISEATLREYYNLNIQRYVRPQQVRLSQIVVDDRAVAEQIATELDAGASFAELARKYSLGPEAAAGGDLGFLTREDLPDSFAPAFRLRPGQRSEVITTEYGYHIFMVSEVEAARTVPFEHVRDDILRIVQAERRRAARQELSNKLRAQARIEVQQDVWQRISHP